MASLRPIFSLVSRIFKKRTWRYILIGSLTLLLLVILIPNLLVSFYASDYLYGAADSLPVNQVGLVPGTSMYSSEGKKNLYFQNRIKATFELYKKGKITYVVVSGTRTGRYYNEPARMKTELIRAGIPESQILVDYEGFSTYESVVRCNKVFGQESFTVISQKFQNKRAVFIGRKMDLDIVAYNARDGSLLKGFRVKLREVFARVKVFLDLYLMGGYKL